MGFDWLVWLIIVWVVSALPLYLTVNMLGGDASILTVVLANVMVAVLAFFIQQLFGFFAGVLTFIAMLFVYKVMFDMGWLRSFLAWLLQFVLIAIFVLVLVTLGLVAIAL